jgi:hypothetical protein
LPALPTLRFARRVMPMQSLLASSTLLRGHVIADMRQSKSIAGAPMTQFHEAGDMYIRKMIYSYIP